jgi:chaperonin GroEL
MTEKIIKDKEFRDGIGRGIDMLANAVKDTLGPKGNTVVLKNAFGELTTTKDGVSVAEEIQLDTESIEAIGAELVKNVALKANNLAGDGTTTATVLAQAIYHSGVKAIELGAFAGDFKRGIKSASLDVLSFIKGMKQDVDTNSKELRSVAMVSSNGDAAIADTITDIYEKLGVHGVISVVQGTGVETEVNMIQGMQFDRGFLSPYSVTDKIKMRVDFDNPYVFIYDGKISQFKQIYQAVEYAGSKNRPIVFVAEDVNESALRGLAVNHQRGNVMSTVVMAPGYGNKRVQRLEDMAILFGGKLVTDDMINSDEGLDTNFNPTWLGEMERAEITNKDTAFIGGAGDPKEIQARADFIISQLDHFKGNKYEVDILETRLGKLTSGVAMIKVGAVSKEEGKELLDRVEDCKHAVRAALQEGVVTGGGHALLAASIMLESKTFKSDVPSGIKAGYMSLLEAIKAPYNQILLNAGLNPDVITLKGSVAEQAYNVRTEEWVDSLQEDGVIDPFKVVRIALESSVSIVGTLLTSNYAVIAKDDVAATTFR